MSLWQNLDPKSGQETIDLIDKIHKEVGATTIIIEHRLEDVLYRPLTAFYWSMKESSSLMVAQMSSYRVRSC